MSVGMDAWHPVLRPWIHSIELRRERCYENWNTTTNLSIFVDISSGNKKTPVIYLYDWLPACERIYLGND